MFLTTLSKPGTRRLIMFLGLSLLIPFLLVEYRFDQKLDYTLGAVIERDVRAEKDLSILNEKETERRREEAADLIPPIFVFDQGLQTLQKDKIRKAFQLLRPQLGEEGIDHAPLKEDFQKQLGVRLTPSQLDVIFELGLSEELERFCLRLIDEAMYSFIVRDKRDFPSLDQGFDVMRVYGRDKTERHYREDFLIKTPDDIRQLISVFALNANLQNPSLNQAAVAIAQSMVIINFQYNDEDTEERRIAAKNAVEPVFWKLQKGEMIIRKGDKVKEDTLRILDKQQEQGSSRMKVSTHFVLSALTSMLVFGLYFFSAGYIKRFSTKPRDLEALAFLTIFMLLFTRITLILGDESSAMNLAGGLYSLWYITPFAGGAMLIRMLINSETAVIWIFGTALLLSIQLDQQVFVGVFFVISGTIALMGMAHTKERLHVLRTGLQTGFINAAAAVLIHLSTVYFNSGTELDTIPFGDASMALLGGVLSGVLALSLIPLFELMGFVTDYRMQELSNRNLPLLQQLRRQAPGTYHHSMNMAALSEAAAEAIGANALQARIACYYHDIGKSLQPQYFIENQRTGSNPHDKRTPEQSAKIIMTHVIDGVALGQEYNLPKPIMDAIETHHGTSLIKYFYVRAVEESGSIDAVDERLFRYPGRLPDTRESGIIFLADRVEAACRTIDTPSKKLYRDMIQTLVNDAIAEGQLELCPLTIKEIYTIIDVFTKTMLDIQHHRITYPKMPGVEEEDPGIITLEVQNPLRKSGPR